MQFSTKFESLQKINSTGQRIREKELVLEALREHGPATSRQLSRLTHKERSNITRTVKDLEYDGKVYVAFTKQCPITGRRVQWYDVAPMKIVSTEAIVAAGGTGQQFTQPELFQ